MMNRISATNRIIGGTGKKKKIGGNMSIKYEDRYFRTKEKNEIPQIESVHILPN